MNARKVISTASLLTAGGFVVAVFYLHAHMNAPAYQFLGNLVSGDAESQVPASVRASSPKDAQTPAGVSEAAARPASIREFAVTNDGPAADDRKTRGPNTRVSAPPHEPGRHVRREKSPPEDLEERILTRARSDARSAQGAGEQAMVVEVQSYLKEEGYYEGALDGISGPKTRAAIRAFESDLGWVQTGRIRSDLLSAIRRR